MAKRKISAKEAVAAIRSGMDDAALMKKYGLAPETKGSSLLLAHFTLPSSPAILGHQPRAGLTLASSIFCQCGIWGHFT